MSTIVRTRILSRSWLILFLALGWFVVQGCGGSPKPIVLSPAPPEEPKPRTPPKEEGPKEQTYDFKKKKTKEQEETDNYGYDDEPDIPGDSSPPQPPPWP